MKRICENCKQWGEPGVIRNGAMRKCRVKSAKSKTPGGVYVLGTKRACKDGFDTKTPPPAKKKATRKRTAK
jgi:hypothetical protein